MGAQAAGMRVVAVRFQHLNITLPETEATIMDYRSVDLIQSNGGWRLAIRTL
jgi:hypothetical protein